jgi:hypothetical protein
MDTGPILGACRLLQLLCWTLRTHRLGADVSSLAVCDGNHSVVTISSPHLEALPLDIKRHDAITTCSMDAISLPDSSLYIVIREPDGQ